MKNLEVRQAARKNRTPLWAVAEKLGISDSTMYRWIRVEMDERKKKLVLNAIQALSDESTGEANNE